MVNKGNLDNVLRMQKQAARIILDAERRTSSVAMFNTLDWVPFYTEADVNRRTLAYKCSYSKLYKLPIKNKFRSAFIKYEIVGD